MEDDREGGEFIFKTTEVKFGTDNGIFSANKSLGRKIWKMTMKIHFNYKSHPVNRKLMTSVD